MLQKRRRVLWAKNHLKLTVSQWESILYTNETILLVIPDAVEKKALPTCCQRSVQKPASLMVWRCLSAHGMGSLHVLVGSISAERYYKGFKMNNNTEKNNNS